MTATTSIDARAARALIDADPDVLIVDVRTPGEFASAHIPGAVNLPLDQVNRGDRVDIDAAIRRLQAESTEAQS